MTKYFTEMKDVIGTPLFFQIGMEGAINRKRLEQVIPNLKHLSMAIIRTYCVKFITQK